MELMRAAELLIDKIRSEYVEDVAVVVMMGSHLYGETHRLSDLDMYFVVNTPRGYELGRTFIIDGIGFDFWPISWERMERIANHDERITAIITEGQVLYYGSEADLERFDALKAKALDVSDEKGFLDKAQTVLDRAYKPFYDLQRCFELSGVRKMAIRVVFSVTQALALVNRDSVKRGRGKLKMELLAMPLVPEEFAASYDVLFESSDVAAIKAAMGVLIDSTSELIQRQRRDYEGRCPESVKGCLAGFYEELINFYNKIEHGIEVCDYVTVFYAACEIVIELEDVFSGTGVSLEGLADIIGAYDLADMDAYGGLVKAHQRQLEALLEDYGVEVVRFRDFEALGESMGKLR
jgi:hypothetical protein